MRRRSRLRTTMLTAALLGGSAVGAEAQDFVRPSPQVGPGSAGMPGGFANGAAAGVGGGSGAGTGTGAIDPATGLPAAGAASNAGGSGTGGAPGSAEANQALNDALASRADLAVGAGSSLGFPSIGDQGGLSSFARASAGVPNPFPPPKPPGINFGRGSVILAPSVRAFKISDNQSPRPQDRVFYGLNYFTNVSGAVNDRLNAPVQNIRVYRNLFGFEKTFNDGYGSVGLRLPLYTLTADSRPGVGFNTPTSTSLGDLGLFAKYIIAEDKKTGSVLTGGLLLTPPTGPNQFAGANYVNSLHSMQFQPFFAYVLNMGKFYVQGFGAIDVPTDRNDVTMLYNDVSFGYLLYQDNDRNSTEFVTAVAPTFEVHVNTPLNHRDAYNTRDIAATSDDVNLTYGLNVELMRTAVATFGLVTPVTSPKPFDVEAVFLLNFRFGPGRTQRVFPSIAP